MSNSKRRQPGGTPAGGQFAPTNRPAADPLGLGVDSPEESDASTEVEATEQAHAEARERALKSAGYAHITPSKMVVANPTKRVVGAKPESPAAYGTVRRLVIRPGEIRSVVGDLEAMLGVHSRDPEESQSWDDVTWKAHLEGLLRGAYEESSVEFAPGGGFVTRIGLPRAPEGTARRRNPDGSVGGCVSPTATVDRGVWIDVGASVVGHASVLDEVRICGQAIVQDNAIVCGHAIVSGRATIGNSATVCEQARVWGNAIVYDNAVVGGEARVLDQARVGGGAIVCGNALIVDRASVTGHARVQGHGQVADNAVVADNALVADNAIVSGRTELRGWRCAVGSDTL